MILIPTQEEKWLAPFRTVQSFVKAGVTGRDVVSLLFSPNQDYSEHGLDNFFSLEGSWLSTWLR
jgi:hypothetical protein